MKQHIRHVSHIMVFLGLIAALLVSCSEDSGNPTAIVDSTSIAYVKEGSGQPAVVFESGLGDGLSSWAPIYEQVASVTTALAYSRPGYPGSMNRQEIQKQEGQKWFE
jgi:hypothetical protein